MQLRISLFTALLLAAFLCGCAAAYNTRVVNSPDEKYQTVCYIRGAYGRSYVSETKKKVVISIYALDQDPNVKKLSEEIAKQAKMTGVWRADDFPPRKDVLLFQKTYWLRCSSLNWESKWNVEDGLSIVFYDYGPERTSDSTMSKRLLCTNNYYLDAIAGIYRDSQ